MPMVYPLLPTSTILRHSNGSRLTIVGAMWPDDSETGRLIAHGEITLDPAAAYRGEAVRVAPPPPMPTDNGGPALKK